MAKYVCEYDTVIQAGEKLCTMATELETSVTNYSSKISSDLSGWTGSAKSTFTTTCDEQVAKAKANAQEAKAVGEFIKKAAQSIQQLDEQLASISI